MQVDAGERQENSMQEQGQDGHTQADVEWLEAYHGQESAIITKEERRRQEEARKPNDALEWRGARPRPQGLLPLLQGKAR